ncbi:MAG TPA: hypothetical protein PK629_09445 [Oscillospiraceae bacterium]|nr:hypothetical protein [Oscillospiraceae bacterium]HPF54964.1 hypothetical protein [Clostridiales bacterium]HPK34377.1 hypothetical protein [Oscillospiraceae bacterium]HPR75823.1 hypothetical protein [Oscillospiraceae bacterium]
MKRAFAVLLLCLITLSGCGQANVSEENESAQSDTSKQVIVSESYSLVQGDISELIESEPSTVPKNISLTAGLPYTSEGKIDFEKIALGYNLIYSAEAEYHGDFDYKEAFQIVMYFGIYDFTEHVKSQLKPYFNEDEWCITLPADAVDEYILSKFGVSVDRSLIEEYNSKTETYLIYPFAGEYYYETEVLSSKTLGNGQYEFYIKTTGEQLNEEGTPVQSWVQRFVIDCTSDDYKYISVSLEETDTH